MGLCFDCKLSHEIRAFSSCGFYWCVTISDFGALQVSTSFVLIRNIHYHVHASLNAMKLMFYRESPSSCLDENRHQASYEVVPGNLTVKILVAGHIWLVFPSRLFSIILQL